MSSSPMRNGRPFAILRRMAGDPCQVASGSTSGQSLLALLHFCRISDFVCRPDDFHENPSSQLARLSFERIEVFFSSGIFRARFSVMRRSMARFSAPRPTRFLRLSSFIVTSRTQCREFSMPRCARTALMNRSGVIASLMMKCRVSRSSLPRISRRASTDPMAARPGQSCSSAS